MTSYADKLQYLKRLYQRHKALWVLVNPRHMTTPRWFALEGLEGDPEAEAYVNDLYDQVALRLPAAQREIDAERENEQETLKYEGQGVEIDSYGPPSLASLRGKKVWLYHGTTTAFSDAVKKDGLVPGQAKPYHPTTGARGKSIFLTARPYGRSGSAEFYADKATHKYGGYPIIYRVLVEGSRLKPDPDDADISSGRYQYIINRVMPNEIKERYKMAVDKKAVLTPSFVDINNLYLRLCNITKQKPDKLQGPDYDEARSLAAELEDLANRLYHNVGYSLQEQAGVYQEFAREVGVAIDIHDLKALPKIKMKVDPEIRRYYRLPDKLPEDERAFKMAKRVVGRFLCDNGGQGE